MTTLDTRSQPALRFSFLGRRVAEGLVKHFKLRWKADGWEANYERADHREPAAGEYVR